MRGVLAWTPCLGLESPASGPSAALRTIVDDRSLTAATLASCRHHTVSVPAPTGPGQRRHPASSARCTPLQGRPWTCVVSWRSRAPLNPPTSAALTSSPVFTPTPSSSQRPVLARPSCQCVLCPLLVLPVLRCPQPPRSLQDRLRRERTRTLFCSLFAAAHYGTTV